MSRMAASDGLPGIEDLSKAEAFLSLILTINLSDD